MKQRCLKCGYEWNSIIDNPKQCPFCKRMDWNKETEDRYNKREVVKINNNEEQDHKQAEENLSKVATELPMEKEE